MVSETPARPVEADEVFRIIRERLADILEIEESRITMEASFSEDLSADSLALIELVEAIEQELEDRAEGFRIEDEDLAELRTVRDAVDYVVERVG
jgi:acyl carrier protein